MSTNQTATNVPKLRFPGFEGEWCCDATTGSLCELIVDCVNKTAPVVEGETPFKMLRTTNVRNGRIDRSECRRVTQETFETWTRRAKVERGDVILTREAPIGEVGYVDFDDTVFLGQRLMQYRVNPAKLDARYLLYSFLSPSLRNQFAAHDGTGSTVSHIRVGDCSKFTVAHPTLPEQQKIAAFLTVLDGRIEQLSRKKALLEATKKGVMQQLFTQTLRFQDDDGHDFPDWEEKALGEIATVIGGGTPESEVDEYWCGDVLWFTPTEIRTKYVSGSKRTITAKGLKNSSAKLLPPGTLLFTSRATIAEVGIATKECTTNQGFQSLVVNSAANNEFVYYCIHQHKKEFLRKAQGSTFLEIGPSEMRKMPLRLPSLPEQTKIAGFLSALDGKIGAVGEQMRQTQAWKKGLLQQMFV